MNIIDVIKRGEFVVLDTETTGLHDGEICQIAIINSNAEIKLNTLVKTMHPIPPDASRIHGITDERVAGAPTWPEVAPQVAEIIQTANAGYPADVIIYNASYDLMMMQFSSLLYGVNHPWVKMSKYWCAMEAFARVYGAWSDYHQSYTWQRLSTAAAYYGLDNSGAHDALADCQMTLGVCRGMAGLLKGASS
jgi:DNA polymerase III subunit epsilon